MGEAGEDFAKPKHAEIEAFEKECKAHVLELTTRLKMTAMNAKRDINTRAAGPGADVLAKVKSKMAEMQERAKELHKNPKSVIIKGEIKKKRAFGASKTKKSSKPANKMDGADDDI